MKKGDICVILGENEDKYETGDHEYPVGLIVRVLSHDEWDDTFSVTTTRGMEQKRWVQASKLAPVLLELKSEGESDD